MDEFYRVPLSSGEALATLATLKAVAALAGADSGGADTLLEPGILESAIARLEAELPEYAHGEAEKRAGTLAAALAERFGGMMEAGENDGEPPFPVGRTRRALDAAWRRGMPVEIEYFVRSRGEWTTRRVDIVNLYEDDKGAWILAGQCGTRNDFRNFRLEFIRRVRVLEDTVNETDDGETDEGDDLPDPFTTDAGRRRKTATGPTKRNKT